MSAPTTLCISLWARQHLVQRERESCRREWKCVMMGEGEAGLKVVERVYMSFPAGARAHWFTRSALIFPPVTFFCHTLCQMKWHNCDGSTRLGGSTWNSVAQELCELTQHHVKIVTHNPPYASTPHLHSLFTAQASLLKLPLPAAGRAG